VSNVPVVGDIAKIATDPGAAIGDVFKKALDPLGLFSALGDLFGGNKTMMSGQADQIAGDVFGKAAERQAFKNFDWQGYEKQVKDRVGPIGEEIANGIINGTIPASQADALMKQRVQAALAGLPTPPPNPDAFPKPENAYDWKARAAREKQLLDPIVEQIVGQIGNDPNAVEPLMQQLKQATQQVQAQLNAEFGTPPEIFSASNKDPKYDYEGREKALNQKLEPILEQFQQMVMQPGSNAEQWLENQMKNVVAQLDSQFGPEPPGPQYDPAKDTKENYEANRWQMESQIQQMQESGATPDKILSYKLQRQAELGQFFPKQAMFQELREEWKSMALQMQAAGKSEGEIKDWLKKKEEAFKEPTPEELQAYSAKAAQQSAEIAQLVQALSQQQESQKKTRKGWDGKEVQAGSF
jgi:hypothetical protein